MADVMDPRRFYTHGPGPNDPLPDPEEEARIKAEKAAQNERDLEESKRLEQERMEKRDAEIEASWTKRVLSKGTGTQCFAGAVIRMHVTGRAKIDPSFVSQRAKETGFKNNSIFEDTRERKVPNLLLIGRGLLVPGLEKAMLSMRAGDHAEVILKPDGGYGAAGNVSNPVVPGSATLTFDVELLSVDKEEELWELSFEQKVSLAEERRQRGNTLVGGKYFLDADAEYEQGMRYLIFNPHPTEEQAAVLGPATLSLHLNMAATKLRLAREMDAIKHCQDALKMSPDHPKAYYRLGQAYNQLGKYALAREQLEKAEKAAQGDGSSLKSIRDEMERLRKRKEKHAQDRKRVAARMGIGSGEEEDNSFITRLKRRFGVDRLQGVSAKSLEGWIWGGAMLVMVAGLAVALFNAQHQRQGLLDAQ